MGHFGASLYRNANNFDMVFSLYILRRVAESEKVDLH